MPGLPSDLRSYHSSSGRRKAPLHKLHHPGTCSTSQRKNHRTQVPPADPEACSGGGLNVSLDSRRCLRGLLYLPRGPNAHLLPFNPRRGGTMRNIVPARIPAHKTRKAVLQSHAQELQDIFTGKISPSQKEAIRSMFSTPNLNTFYENGNLAGVSQ